MQVLHVESDVEEAINLIVEDKIFDRPLMPLILDCIKLILEFKKFKIRHMFREANGVVDAMAKETVILEKSLQVLLIPRRCVEISYI